MILFTLSDPVVIAAAVSSVGSLAAVILNTILSQRSFKHAKRDQADRKREIAQVHVLVNDQMDRALRRIASLEQRLGLEPGEPIPAARKRRRTD